MTRTIAIAASLASCAPSRVPATTRDELHARFEQCWQFFDDARWDDLKSCYASDAAFEAPGSATPGLSGADAIVTMSRSFKAQVPDLRGEHQLELIDDHALVAVTLVIGTASGAKIGLFTSQVLDVNDRGEVTHEADYVDHATMLGQLKPDRGHPVRPATDRLWMSKQVVVAKHDAAEKANADVEHAYEDAFNKHDLDTLAAVFADDLVWWEEADLTDENKTDALGDFDKFWKKHPEVQLTRTRQWAAGDYVATVGALEMTGVHVPSLQILKIDRGRMQRSWLLFQSAAMRPTRPAAPSP